MPRRARTTETTAESNEAVTPTPEENGTVSTEPVFSEADAATSYSETVVIDETPTATAEIDTGQSADEAKAAKPELDLTGFKVAVATAVAERDMDTGTLPVAQIESVKAVYRELEGAKAKGAARKYLQDQLRDAINRMDMAEGKSIMELSDAMASAGSAAKAAAEKAPADPTDAYVQRLSLLNLAYNLAYADRPDSVNEDEARAKAETLVQEHTDAATQYYTWIQKPADERGDEPEVDSLVKKAVKVAMGKVISAGTSGRGGGGSAGGPRRNVSKHIQEAFAEQPPGTFLLIAEIAKFKSSEYPEGDVSQGAVSSRLFPSSGKVTVEGVKPGVNEADKRGAYKLAA